jgi:cytochrome c553
MLQPGIQRVPIMKTLLLAFGLTAALTIPMLASGSSNAAQEGSDTLNSRPNLDHGAELFRSCAACHGASGGGTSDGKVPRIAGQHFSVLVKQVVDFRNGLRWDPLMEYMSDKHLLKSAQDIADVAAYASEIETLPDASVSVGSGQFLARGAEVYRQSCIGCHGKSGEGDREQEIPKVAGQNYAYLVRQIHDAVEHRRPNFDASHIGLLGSLDYAAIMGVADYLARIPRRSDRISQQGLAAN